MIKTNLEFKTVFDSEESDSISCYRIPSILTASNGDLIVAADQRVPSCGDLRSNENVNIVIRRSEDDGDTWSAIKAIVDYPLGESASDPSMILDRTTKDIFLFFNYMDLKNAAGKYRLKLIKSKDHGKSWSKPIDITKQIIKEDWEDDFMFITSGRGIQTHDGQLLHTLVNLDKGLHVFGSDDHGANWFLIDTPISPGDESKIVELNPGHWLINSRVNKAGLRYTHQSIDEGHTWSTTADSILVDPACNASLLKYRTADTGMNKNLLLFSNVNSSDSRSNLTIKLSQDEGKSWAYSQTIYSGKAAYSSMTILRNGDIAVFFERDDYKTIDVVKFPIKWITAKEAAQYN